MASLLPPAKQVFTDANGAPLVAGTIAFYIPNTTTPKDTWQDSGQTILNTNPVVLDSYGSAIIYGSGAYRAVLKDALGNTIYDQLTQDNTQIVSQSTAPTSPFAGEIWHDITNGFFEVRDQANLNWTISGVLDELNKVWMSPVRSYLAGLQLSNDATTPNTKLDVSAGICMDDTNVYPMSLAAGVVDFTVNGVNGLDAGSIANSTWYHAFAIGGAGKTPGFLASTSLSSPTYPTGYTYKRRLGSVKTDGSAHLLAFKQCGDIFQWTPVNDINTSSTTTASRTLYTLSTPPGVKTQALVRYDGSCSTAQFLAVVTSPDEPDTAASGANVDLVANQSTATAGSKSVLTNTSSQVGIRTSAVSQFSLVAYGWIDRRGRDD